MKILQVNTEKTWRGGERQTLYVCQGLINAGYKVELICRAGTPLAQKARTEGITIHEVANNRAAFSFMAKHGKRYDIIHAQSAKAQTNAVASKMFHKRPIVCTRRVNFPVKGGLSKWKYNQTDKLVAISGAVKAQMESQGFTNISLIPSVVIAKELNQSRAEETINQLGLSGKKFVGTMAALVPNKDPMTMLAAIAELKKQRDDFAFLHFGDGELKEAMEKAIADNQLQDTYYLMGYTENAEDFYSVLDVYTLSSLLEGLGSSVLDAFIYKVPVACTDDGAGLAETVKDRGLLSPIKKPQELAENINRLLSKPELVEKLTTKAYNEVIENYSLEKTTQEYLKIYQELL